MRWFQNRSACFAGAAPAAVRRFALVVFAKAAPPVALIIHDGHAYFEPGFEEARATAYGPPGDNTENTRGEIRHD